MGKKGKTGAKLSVLRPMCCRPPGGVRYGRFIPPQDAASSSRHCAGTCSMIHHLEKDACHVSCGGKLSPGQRPRSGVCIGRKCVKGEPMPRSKVDVHELQVPIRDQYTKDPGSAPVVLRVSSGSSDLSDPLHCSVRPDGAPGADFRSGAHPAVGGDGDVPCPGTCCCPPWPPARRSRFAWWPPTWGSSSRRLRSRWKGTGTPGEPSPWEGSSRSAHRDPLPHQCGSRR